MKALVIEEDLARFGAARLASSWRSGGGGRVGPLSLRDVDAPSLPGEGWVELRPRLSGICGSDLATVDGRSSRWFEPIVSFPFTLLYCGGIITAILAIIFGLLARAKVRRGEAMSGAGMGLAGIILGVCALIFAVTLLAVVVVLQQGISRGNSGGAGY